MSMTTVKPPITAARFEAMPGQNGYELIDGRLVENRIGAKASQVATRIIRRLAGHCEGAQLGCVFDAECGYQCFPGFPNRVRKPDVSFVRADRLPGGQIPEGFFRFAPDLVVEVNSPGDSVSRVREKIKQFLDAGVSLLWEVDPRAREVYVYRADGSMTRLREGQQLDGENVVPGFLCRVDDLFPPPSTIAGTAPSQPAVE